MTARVITGWWRNASRQAKMEQLSGAIEARLTARETALLLGTKPENIRSFASTAGLSFAGSDKTIAYERLSEKARSRRSIKSAGSFDDFRELSF
jgi:hypothetical protein